MDATNNNKRTRANSGRQQSNRVCGQRGADASRGNQGRRPLATLALIVLTSAAAAFALDAPGNAQERLVALSMGSRSSSITITAGKTQDVRVDAPFTDITVGAIRLRDMAGEPIGGDATLLAEETIERDDQLCVRGRSDLAIIGYLTDFPQTLDRFRCLRHRAHILVARRVIEHQDILCQRRTC